MRGSRRVLQALLPLLALLALAAFPAHGEEFFYASSAMPEPDSSSTGPGPAPTAAFMAYASLRGHAAGFESVSGEATLTWSGVASEAVKVAVVLNGMPAAKSYATHVHVFGDMNSAGAVSTAIVGSHFNPTNAKHGCPPHAERHVGDLGNFVVTQAMLGGLADGSFDNTLLALTDAAAKWHSVVGRSLILHSAEDNCQDPVNAGSPVIQGVIALVQPDGGKPQGAFASPQSAPAALAASILPVAGDCPTCRGSVYIYPEVGSTTRANVLVRLSGFPANEALKLSTHEFAPTNGGSTTEGSDYVSTATFTTNANGAYSGDLKLDTSSVAGLSIWSGEKNLIGRGLRVSSETKKLSWVAIGLSTGDVPAEASSSGAAGPSSSTGPAEASSTGAELEPSSTGAELFSSSTAAAPSSSSTGAASSTGSAGSSTGPAPLPPAVKLVVKLTMQIEDVTPTFKQNFIADTAAAIKANPDQIEILNVRAGSVIIDFLVKPLAGAPPPAALVDTFVTMWSVADSPLRKSPAFEHADPTFTPEQVVLPQCWNGTFSDNCPPEPTPQPPKDDSDPWFSGGNMAGIVIMIIVVGLAIIAAIVYFVMQHRKKSAGGKRFNDSDAAAFSSIEMGQAGESGAAARDDSVSVVRVHVDNHPDAAAFEAVQIDVDQHPPVQHRASII